MWVRKLTVCGTNKITFSCKLGLIRFWKVYQTVYFSCSVVYFGRSLVHVVPVWVHRVLNLLFYEKKILILVYFLVFSCQKSSFQLSVISHQLRKSLLHWILKTDDWWLFYYLGLLYNSLLWCANGFGGLNAFICKCIVIVWWLYCCWWVFRGFSESRVIFLYRENMLLAPTPYPCFSASAALLTAHGVCLLLL